MRLCREANHESRNHGETDRCREARVKPATPKERTPIVKLTTRRSAHQAFVRRMPEVPPARNRDSFGEPRRWSSIGICAQEESHSTRNVRKDSLAPVVRDWSAFDGFRRPASPIRQWTWASIGAWQETLEAGLKVRRADLAKRRQEWETALRDLDLGDPSAVDRTFFRVLRREREEDWSDWLAQLIEDSKTGLFVETLFGGRRADPFAIKQVHREVSCHEGWRADIIVEWKDSSYTHVEVKVGDPNLDKTFETAVAIQQRFHGQRRRCDFILLLPEQREDWDQRCEEDPKLGGLISALTWIDVARALRLALRERKESPAWRVWAHAFCGAIEQKLLQIPACEKPVEWAQGLRFSQLTIATELLRTEEF